jgi:NAD+ synthase (glutamine-hydrolysing)
VIGDVYKTDVFGLSRWINRESEIIPWHTIEKVPSAELRPDQKDTDSLPDYPVLDAILYQYVECSQSPDAIVAQGFDSALVNKVIRLVNANEFKRKQVAPILSVSYKPFSRRLMPIGRFVV